MDPFNSMGLMGFKTQPAVKKEEEKAPTAVKRQREFDRTPNVAALAAKVQKTNDATIKKLKPKTLFDIEESDDEEGNPLVGGTHKMEDEQNDVQNKEIMNRNECLHEVVVPKNYAGPDPMKMKPLWEEPAKAYPFQLDEFQRISVQAIENNMSVLVSAHTSAGKTAIAEYAIATSLKQNSRVVYTSPIKALSNQKFRDLEEEFGSVGLMTGDVTKNPNASCMVMTTEILRSMLYRGSELLNEVKWVIFDEVHYMRDRERGVVWEETLILLPNNVKHVFLSATIPNAKEFAGWIANIKGDPVHVVYTDYRPTPLQHYAFPSGGDQMFQVVNEKGQFKEDSFYESVRVLQRQGRGYKGKGGQKMASKQGGDIKNIVKTIMQQNFYPCIIFSFSKRDCEKFAQSILNMNLNEEEERSMVVEIFNAAIQTLTEDDQKLPQVVNMLPLLQNGIGIHHSGLLPIIKEVIELLFQEGLVKVLFSTETFSMGLNMPARTVVFTNYRKFDGQDLRLVSSGEYIQMSGRAGRRGIDDRGIVVIMMKKDLDESQARQMLSGKPDKLNSAFYLSYYMILNLMRVEEITPEYIMQRSLLQFQNEQKKPELEKQKLAVEHKLKDMVIENEGQMRTYYYLKQQIDLQKNHIRGIITKPIYAAEFLNPGRMVKVTANKQTWGWGPIINFSVDRVAQSKPMHERLATDYSIDVLLLCDPVSVNQGVPMPAPNPQEAVPEIVPVSLNSIEAFSNLRIYLNKNLKSVSSRREVMGRIKETISRLPDQKIPQANPITDMNIAEELILNAQKELESLQQRLKQHPLHEAPHIDEAFATFKTKVDVEHRRQQLAKEIEDCGRLSLIQDLSQMQRVLRRLQFVSKDNHLLTKGRVAAEISAGDSLVLTELIFHATFNTMPAENIAALLSAMVFEAKPEDNASFKFNIKPLQEGYEQLLKSAKRVAEVSKDAGIHIEEDTYVHGFSPLLMEVTHAWCKGAPFIDITKMTSIYEGSIVRCMRRLDELLRQLCVATRTIGDTALEEKFAQASQKLKRDIVFSTSLYI